MTEAGDSSLERWFVEHGVSEEQLVVARHTARGIGSSLGAALVARGVLAPDQLATALSEAHGLPRWDGRVDESLVEKMTRPVCRRAMALPVARNGSRLVLAVADPTKRDILEVAAFACRALDVDLVVGADSSILDALDPPEPTSEAIADFASLAAALARHKPIEPRHEARLREQREREEVHDTPTARLANLLLIALARGPATAARFRIDVGGPIELFHAGQWRTEPRFARLPLGPLLVREMAIHLTAMAGMPSVAEDGVSTIHLVIGRTRAWHAGEVCGIDIDLERTVDGMAVVLSRAGVRYGSFAYGEVEKEAFGHLDRFYELLSPSTVIDARRELEKAEAKLWALDGRTANMGALLRVARAHLADSEGNVEEAERAYESALACSDVPFGIRSSSVIDVLSCALDTRRYAAVLAPAKELIRAAHAYYGVPGITAIHASQLLGRAHFALGEVAAAEAVAADVSRWAPSIGSPGPLYASWLTGLAHRARGRLAAAEGELRSALEQLNAAGGEPPGPRVGGYLHIDLAQVLSAQDRRRDEAGRILERAKELVRRYPPTHAARTAVDRAMAALAGVHPYR